MRELVRQLELRQGDDNRIESVEKALKEKFPRSPTRAIPTKSGKSIVTPRNSLLRCQDRGRSDIKYVFHFVSFLPKWKVELRSSSINLDLFAIRE